MTYVIHTLSGSYTGKTPPDGGWGWVVVFAAFFIDALAFSAVRGIGLFYNDIMYDLELNNSETSLIISLLAGVIGLSGLISDPLIKCFGTRVTIMIGGFFSAAGLILLSFSNSLLAACIAAFVNGIGSGTSYIATNSQLNMYFLSKRALANGVSLSGSPLYSTLFPFIALKLLSLYGWRGSFIVIAGLNLHILAFAALIRPIVFQSDLPSDVRVTLDVDKIYKPNKKSFLRKYWVCLLLLICNVILMFGFASPFVYIVPYAGELGFPQSDAAGLLACTCVGDFVGRPLCGVLMARVDIVKRKIMLSTVFALSMYTLIQLIPIFTTRWLPLVVYSVLLGFWYGVIVVLNMTAIPLIMGTDKRLNTYFAWFFCSGTVPTFVSGYVVGFIIDIHGTYTVAFIYTLIILFTTTLWVLMCHFVVEKRNGKVIND